MASINIKNRKTGVTKEVTQREWETIQKNPLVAKVWVLAESKAANEPVPAKEQKASKVTSEAKN